MFKHLASFLAKPRIVEKIKERAFKTPYFHLIGEDGGPYMSRWWFFNPDVNAEGDKKYPMVPFSIRLHRIHRADNDRFCHNHPGDFRTFVLQGWYEEERLIGHPTPDGFEAIGVMLTRLEKGETQTLSEEDYHSVTAVSPGGVWTLFVMWEPRKPKVGSWGFLVNGKYMPWRRFLARKDLA